MHSQSTGKTARVLVLLSLSFLTASALFLAVVAGRVAWDVCVYHWLPDARQAVATR